VHGQWRFAVMVVAALVVASAVWTWLPPDDATQAAVRDTIARFESAKWLVWPSDRYGETDLSAPTRERLEDRRHRELMTLAEGAALEDALHVDAVAALLRSPRLRDGRLPVSCRADVVYFDVRRRTLRGELLVRAACDIVQTTGRWNPRTGEIVDLAEDEPSTLCQVFDYTLVQRGNAWRVVAKEPVGSQDGGPPSFYDRSTGAFVQDTGT